jgi:hypothetical protein
MAPKKVPEIPAPTLQNSLSLADLGLIEQTAIAELFNKKLRTIQRMEARGELPPSLPFARTKYYRRESVIACLAQRERTKAAGANVQPPHRRRARKAEQGFIKSRKAPCL